MATLALNEETIERLIQYIRDVPGCDINLRINSPKEKGQEISYINHKFNAGTLWVQQDRRQLPLFTEEEQAEHDERPD